MGGACGDILTTRKPEREEREERGRDTELTLGVGALLGFVFSLCSFAGCASGWDTRWGIAVRLRHRRRLRNLPGRRPLPIRSRCRQTNRFPSLQRRRRHQRRSRRREAMARRRLPRKAERIPQHRKRRRPGETLRPRVRLGARQRLPRRLSHQHRCGRRSLQREAHRRVGRRRRRLCVRHCPEARLS